MHLHIISFDTPYPANYGGAIDVFYRLQALYRAGVRITLHCSYKGTLQHYDELESLCEKVYYYERDMSWLNIFTRLPYTVKGRINPILLENLLQDDDPILFEGLVSCYYLSHPMLAKRKKYFRGCNIEHDYYNGLARATNKLWKYVYYKIEARRLRRFEPIIRYADAALAISHQDEEHYRSTYPDLKVYYLPASHQNEKITASLGKGNYILYHGNLGVAENDKAAMWLCKHIIPQMPNVPFVIAGRQPTNELISTAQNLDNLTLIASPTQQELEALIHDAHIHLLVTFQATGLKLKLLNVLYQGRFVVTNPELVCGTELSSLCMVGKTPQELIQICTELMQQEFTSKELEKRSILLNHLFSNKELGQSLVDIIFGV